MSAPAVFDRLAARYDRLWTESAIGRAQRGQVWRQIDGLFRAGDRVLDVGCGTGEDAAHLAARGVRVYAIDASAAMVEQARQRGGFTAQVLRAEEIARIGEPFDGALSNFGALNCVEDLPAIAQALADVVRPGGRVAVCLIGRFCAWETLYYAARLELPKAWRRMRGSADWAGRARVLYPSISEMREAFQRAFHLQRWSGVGLLVPPSYVPLPRLLVRWFDAVDRLLARLPFLRALCDHRLLILVRK